MPSIPASTDEIVHGRLPGRKPVAVVDIGSNSVRLVIYEGNTRAPSVLFNEKVLSGLGRGLAATGRLDDAAIDSAVSALTRFRALCVQSGVEKIYPIATAAAREAENGRSFVERAEAALGQPIVILSGAEEAHYAAEGVMAGWHAPDGLAGDLGGGSLEIVDIRDGAIGRGVTLPLGGLRLQDISGGDIAKARDFAASEVARTPFGQVGKGRAFYAVGGTWRNLAKLHIEQTNYPLHVMHGYRMRPDVLLPFLADVASGDPEKLPGIAAVSRNRRGLLAYGAVALQAVIAHIEPAEVILSAYGVREGYLHAHLPDEEKSKDPLMEAAREFSFLRSRSPQHSEELVEWSTRTFAALGLEETADEERYRKAACFLADISWRAHPDYRGSQSLAVIVNGAFPAIDHPGRAFIGLCNYFRYEGLSDQKTLPDIERLIGDKLLQRVRVLASLFRVTYLLSAAMPGVLDRLRWASDPRGGFTLVVPKDLEGLLGERPAGRVQQFGKIVDRKLRLEVR